MSNNPHPTPETLYIGRFNAQKEDSAFEVYLESRDAYEGGDLEEAQDGRVCGVYQLVKTVRVKQVMTEEVISSTPAAHPGARKKTKRS